MVEKISIIDNFLAEEEFINLRDTISAQDFPWNFSPILVQQSEKLSPGFFTHPVYGSNVPCSQLYPLFLPILDKKLNVAVSLRIKINLNTRLPEPYISDFHSDVFYFEKDMAAKWTTSIFYINTNNGYTELEEDGTKIESVANRLVSFPANTKHRAVTQTDEQRRLVINFYYLKKEKGKSCV